MVSPLPPLGGLNPSVPNVAQVLEQFRAALRARDIVPPEQLMKTLTDRKLAEQERVTFETQRLAQSVRQERAIVVTVLGLAQEAVIAVGDLEQISRGGLSGFPD